MMCAYCKRLLQITGKIMKKEAVHVRVDLDLKKKLAAAAQADKRTVSNLVIKILEEWCAGRGKAGADAS